MVGILLPVLVSDKNEAEPDLLQLEGFQFASRSCIVRRAAPAFSTLDERLEAAKRSKGTLMVNRSFGVQHPDDVIAEVLSMRASTMQRGKIALISRTQARMKALAPLESCTLPGRCQTSRTCRSWRWCKTGDSTALPFLLPVKADGGAFGEPASRQYRAVEVQCDARKPQTAEVIESPLPGAGDADG